jgi:hypothetical protein
MKIPDYASEHNFDTSIHTRLAPLWTEVIRFVVENKNWWLIPILLVFGLIRVQFVLSSTGAVPFLYTCF